MEKSTLTELAPSIKEEIENFVDQRIHRENATILQSIETLALRLSHQGELIQKGFEMTEKRLEAMEKRLEDMNKHLEEARHYSDKRFEDMNKRFEEARHYSDKRFEDMNRRFEDMNKRFEDMNKRFNTLQWMIGIGFTAIAILMAFFRFYNPS